MDGRIHSFQSLGTVDGPGVRFVAFLQGCPLRCGCCHNPDTWQRDGGQVYSAEAVVSRAIRYREYFGTEGGITLSGGEPLMQPEFVQEIFERCHAQGIHTCLDTSGCLRGESVERVLAATDYVLLDIKYTTDAQYRAHAGCGMDGPLTFLGDLNRRGIPTTLRQVIIPTINDDVQNVIRLSKLANAHACVQKVELLPFRKMCQHKYDQLGIAFPFGHLPEPTKEQMQSLETHIAFSGVP